MVITNYAKNQMSLFLTGSQSNNPSYFIIGSGSGTALATQTELIAATDRQAVTSSTNPVTQKAKWQGDWNSAEASGLSLKEFGIIPSGDGLTGSIWSRTSMPSVTFDGTTELRIEENWEIF